jgi:diacylglycerol kinase family enzyme
MNGRRMGGMFQMAPQSLNDDGLFDLCVAGQTSKMRILGLIPYFVKGTQATQPEIQTARTSRLVVTALKGALPAHGDGETLCTEGQQLTLELLPLQIEVLCQPGEEAA